MTIICAVKDTDGSVVIGSDSRMTSHSYIFPVVAKKWVRVGRWRLGCSGSVRFDLLLDPTPACLAIPDDLTVPQFAKALFDLMKEDGWNPEAGKDGGPVIFNQQFIIVSPELRVFEFLSSGALVDLHSEFAAVGSGCEFAAGAAFAIRDRPAIERVRVAIEAAIAHQSDCGGEIFIERVMPLLPASPRRTQDPVVNGTGTFTPYLRERPGV